VTAIPRYCDCFDAYPDDAEASAEFRRFTADDLTTRKAANARRIIADLAAAAGSEHRPRW
jgi:hypothetical protein